VSMGVVRKGKKRTGGAVENGDELDVPEWMM
jgi:hypothetical protein